MRRMSEIQLVPEPVCNHIEPRPLLPITQIKYDMMGHIILSHFQPQEIQ